MKRTLYTVIVLVGALHLTSAQETFSTLEIGYETSQNLPEEVVLGINGEVYIQDGTPDEDGSLARTINSEHASEFSLWVEKGVVAEDLAVGGRRIWLADYVFAPNYELSTLKEIKKYVETHKHLPGVPGQEQLDEDGYFGINEMVIAQLEKLEELLLHTIAQEKKIVQQKKESAELRILAEELSRRIQKIEQKSNRNQ